MKIPLSDRLRACCNFVAPGDRVADIGTDHGYLGIWLLSQGIARSVIASDIAPGPLSAARRNAEKYGCTERMEFCLCPGVEKIPRDFDTLVCAGMGADTMVSILCAAPWLKDKRYRLILQCQSKTPMLRRYLSEHDWYINREVALRDGRFLYTVMEVIWQPCTPMSPGAWFFSEAMQEHPSADAPAYYRWVKNGLEIMVKNRGEKADPELAEALAELESLLNNPNLSWLKEEKA